MKWLEINIDIRIAKWEKQLVARELNENKRTTPMITDDNS